MKSRFSSSFLVLFPILRILLAMISVILAGLGLGLFLSISVGPTIFAILKYSINYGWRAGLSFVLGVSISDFIYVILANLASVWLIALLPYLDIIGYIGSSIFIGMGLYGILKKIKVTRNRNDDAKVSSKDYWKIMGSGFILNAFNPGVMITWFTAVAAVANFKASAINQHDASSYAYLFFGSCLALVLGFDILKVFLAQLIRKKLTPRKIVYLNRISALCILAIGVFILTKISFGIKLGGY
jgi:threonine/homoserine/homoserine lactone efflux protein